MDTPPPTYQDFLKRQIKRLLLLRVTMLSLVLGVSSLLQFLQLSPQNLSLPPLLAILTFILSIYVFSIGSAIIINRVKRYTLFAYGQILADSLFIAVIVYFSGGSHSIFTFMFLFPVISSGLLLFRKGAMLMATFSICSYAAVLSSEYVMLASDVPLELRPTLATSLNILIQNVSVYGLSFYLVAFLSSTLATRLRRTEEALSRTERNLDRLSLLYKQIFDDIASGIITVNAKGAITSFNNAAEQITGYTASEVMGKAIDQLFTDFTSSAKSGQRPVINISRKDNKKIPVGYSWTRLHMPDGCEDCRVYTLQDLRKIKKMEKQVKQSEKMAAIGEIAAGIAHEFRNPLAAISGATQILNQEKNIPNTNKSLLNIISRECTRLEENIGDFLQFSKPAVPDKVWLSLSNIVDESWEVITQSAAMPDNCTLKTDIPANLDCWVDQHQIKQVMINLLHNSCQAMANSGGTIQVLAKEEALKKDKATLQVTVTDNGCGIPADMLKNIWEPFFTTRENGTGLGLAIVKQIIEGHNGQLTVTSTPQQGTSFTVHLPLP